VSISDPAHPNVIGGGLIIGVEVLRVDASGAHACLSTKANGVYIYDVSDPQHLVLLSKCRSGDLVWGVALTTNYAFVAADEAGLRIISIADPSDPTDVGYYDMSGWVNAVALTSNYVYAAYGREGLQVFQFYAGGVEETPGVEARITGWPTVVRNTLELSVFLNHRVSASTVMLDISGRKVLDLYPGANDISRLAPGVYFVRSAPGVVGEASSVARVIISR
jgi:hypothetical protein